MFDRPISSGLILTVIKILHTVVWGFFVAWIIAIWVFAWGGNLRGAALAVGVVSIEVVILVLNGLRCPLNRMAARYTTDHCANFDIYLPQWLAGQTMPIFGGLYVGGIMLTLARWALLAR